MKFSLAAGLMALSGLAPLAQAHVTLETPRALAGSDYKAVLRVGHGCDGAATTRLRVRIPEGVLAVKPQPKAGWTLDLTRGSYGQPQTLHGALVKSGVREISWSGNLPDAYYEEFVFRVYLSKALGAGQTVYFPVVQECGQAAEQWIDTSGHQGAQGPAPGVIIEAPEPRGHGGSHDHRH
ncbi:MAG: YcnI family protein [Castellaniella sp.]|uniref:YcnI family copper-binding membrane protein n=1 Tax=Castellaniella sp. TaxID=1955812 RepID=UPI003A8A7EF9